VDCMYSPSQLCTFPTAHFSGGGWYLDCIISFTYPSEVDFHNSLEGLDAIDLDVDEFSGITDRQGEWPL